MGIYVEAQTAINQRRMAEFEAQVQAAELAKQAEVPSGLSVSPDERPAASTTIVQ